MQEDNETKYCKDRYSTCDVDTSGNNCKDDWFYKDSVCHKSNPSDTETTWIPPPRPPPPAPHTPHPAAYSHPPSTRRARF